MSFNIRYGTADDGANSWPSRRSACFACIRAHAPDLLCVQEALDFQLAELLAEMPEYRAVGVGRDDGSTQGEFAPILYRDCVGVPAGSGTFWFSPQPDVPGSRHPECFHPRICTWINFGQFVIYNVHLDNESSDARCAAIDQMLAAMAPGPRIVAGDFNAAEGDKCIDRIRASGLRDSHRQIHQNKPAQTFHGFGASASEEKIDYVWVSEEWAVSISEIDTRQYGGRWPSDHFPVVTQLAAE